MPIERIPLTQLQLFEVNNFYEKLFISKVEPLFPNSVYLEWEVNDDRILENKRPVYSFNIYRSMSEAGEWTLLNQTPVSDLFYLDEAISQFSLHRAYYYKIIA